MVVYHAANHTCSLAAGRRPFQAHSNMTGLAQADVQELGWELPDCRNRVRDYGAEVG